MMETLLRSSRRRRAGRSGDVRQQQEADGAQHEQQETILLQGARGRATSAEEVSLPAARSSERQEDVLTTCD